MRRGSQMCKIRYHKITFRRIIMILLILPYLEPAYISPFVEHIFNLGKIISFLICVFIFLTEKGIQKHADILRYIICFYTAYLLSTIINRGDLIRGFIDSITVIGWCILTIDLAFSERNKDFFIALVYLYDILLIVNLVSIVLFPGGILQMDMYFLGHDDTLLNWSIPDIIFSYLLDQISINKRNHPYTFVALLLLVMTNMMTGSASGYLSILVLLFGYVILKDAIIGFHAFNVALLVLNIGLIFFRIQRAFAFLIEKILHRNVGLTGREKIWKTVLPFIYDRPILGYGSEYSFIKASKFTLTDGSYFQFAHCHSFFLQTLYESGIIGLSLFLFVYLSACHSLMNGKADRSKRLIGACLMAMMISLTVNAYMQPIALFTILIIGCEVKSIQRNMKRSELTDKRS